MPDMDNWILALGASKTYTDQISTTNISNVDVVEYGGNTYLRCTYADGSGDVDLQLNGLMTSDQQAWVKKYSKELLFNNTTNQLEYKGVSIENVFVDIKANFPTTGNKNVIYINSKDNSMYRWDDTNNKYVELAGGSTGSSDKMNRTDPTVITVGGIQAGSIVDGKTAIELWEEALFPYQKPIINTFTLTSNITPNASVHEIGTLITSLVLSASITKKSKPLTFVKFYEGSTILNTQTGTSVANGGTFSYTHTLNNDDTDTTYKVECSDGDNTVNKTATVKFARNTFYGTDSITTYTYTTSAEIRALTGKKLGLQSGATFTITIPVGAKKVVFAIPSTLSMTDVTYQEGLGASVKGVFTQSTVNVDGANGYTGIDYKIYEYAPVSPFSAVCHYTVVL